MYSESVHESAHVERPPVFLRLVGERALQKNTSYFKLHYFLTVADLAAAEMIYTALFIHRQTKRRAASGTVNATEWAIYRPVAAFRGMPETVHARPPKKMPKWIHQ